MSKIRILVPLLILGFFVVTLGKVSAICTTTVYKPSVNANGDDGITGIGDKTREEGKSICSAKEKKGYTDGGLPITEVNTIVLKCGVNGFEEISTCKDGNTCVDNTDNTAACVSNKKNDCEAIYEGNIIKIENGERACIDSTTKGECNGTTGKLENVGVCGAGEFCKTDWNWNIFVFGRYYRADCKPAACIENSISAKEGASKCIGSIIKKCTSGSFVNQETCPGSCIDDPVKGPICNGDKYNTDSCSIIKKDDGSEISTDRKSLTDRSVCYENKIYNCNTVPYYTFSSDCGDKTCYEVTGEKYAKCGTDEEISKTDGVIGTVTTTVTVDSSSTYNPLCANGTGINTSLGCIPTDIEKFVPWLLKWLFGIAGGIAFLLMAYGFILVATSGGDDKKMAGAKETITSAITGLLVCIFAIFILRLIAVNILHIPGIN
jgi:hypothetical protein